MTFIACDDDDDDMPDEPMGTLQVEDQLVTGDTINVPEITMSEDGWVVIHRSTGSGPQVPDIISVPKQVEIGESTDVQVALENGTELDDGEELFVMLHTDDGEIGEYEFDGDGTPDQPITDDNGDVVTKPIIVDLEGFEASDQTITQDTVTVESVTVENDGWVVIHRDDNGGPLVPDIISQPVQLESGTTTDVSVPLESVTIEDGETLWIMLHNDSGELGTYEFDGNTGLDLPLTDRQGEILTAPITVDVQ